MTTTRHGLARPAGRWLRIGTIGLETLIAAAATYGGVGLIAGNAIGMPADWLTQTPFHSWVWPGVFLLAIVALPMAFAAICEITRRPWAYQASVAAGAAQVGWILGQWAVIGRYFVLQPVMLLAGALVMAMAWLTHRRQPIRVTARPSPSR